jgi:NADH-quinone oxidoreductase subunit J
VSSTLGFWLISAVILVSALFVVRAQNLIHAVLWLAMTLLGTAALYATLNAPFLAGVQVLTYIGGVVTLMIFGVMVTRRHESTDAPAETEGSDRGFVFASALFVLLAVALWKSQPAVQVPGVAATSAQLAHALVEEYLVPFEVLSMLLLAAIVGAVVLARKKDPLQAAAPAPAPAALPVTLPSSVASPAPVPVAAREAQS